MKNELLKKITVALLIVVMSVTVFGQYTPIRGIGTDAKPLNGNGICLGCFNGSMDAVVDANLDNSVSLGNFATLVSGNGISVKNNNFSYPAGNITGFNVDLGTSPITATLLSSLQISTYKNNVLQESTTSSTLLSVPAFGGTKSRVFLHFKTSKNFDEVRLFQTNSLSIFGALNVYYAFAFDPANAPVDNNGICDDIIAGGGVDGNVSGSSQFIAPLSYVQNRERIGDGDKNSYGSIVLPAGLLGSYSVGVLDKNQVYPSGNRAGFVISPDDEGKLLSAEFLKNVTIETYLYGQLQDTKTLSDGGGLINIKVLGFGSGKQKVSLTTTKPFNEIRLKITQTVGVNIGALKVYYAFEEPISCDCDDKIQTSGSAITGSILSGSSWTSGQGLFGIFFSKMTNPGNITDTNKDNYATATIPAVSFLGVFSAYATVKTNELQPANTFAGFTLAKAANLIGLSVLQNITVTLYNNDVQTDIFTGNGSLVNGNFFTTESNKFYVGGKATKPFNRIKIFFNGGTGLNFLPQEYYIYNAFASKDADNDGVPDCFDLCPNGNDSIDNNGNGIPDCAEGCVTVNDKSQALDSDGDGVPDACDQDSDNDGVGEAAEDANNNGVYQDDDLEGGTVVGTRRGDNVANYLDLDSDNDGILDLFESGVPVSIINQIDTDHNGVIDVTVEAGDNGIADILETYTDSGIMKYPLKDTDNDGRPDFIDITSDGANYDLYVIGKDYLDTTDAGFISTILDFDLDGIQAVVDNDLVSRGSPNSPLSPYASFAKGASVNEKPSDIVAASDNVSIYPNPVKQGENLYVKSSEEISYKIFSAQGQLVKSGKLKANEGISTSSLTAGMYIVNVQTENITKAYKVIVK